MFEKDFLDKIIDLYLFSYTFKCRTEIHFPNLGNN